jgi:hypothetical protein
MLVMMIDDESLYNKVRAMALRGVESVVKNPKAICHLI